MTFGFKGSSAAAVLIAACATAQANPTVVSVSVFATGAAVGATAPDSITTANGSVWVEYGNGVDSTGVVPGDSTIVQYGLNGAVQHTYSISGSVDGLKYNPVTGLVWALQNQDANATLSLINPTTHVVTGPLLYAAPPYAYGANPPPPPANPPFNNGRGYDDVAFLNGKVYLSYTNPSAAGDPVIQVLDQGNTPSGTLTTTDFLTAGQTGLSAPDTDSLKSTPNGSLVLTSGDNGLFTLITNPGTGTQAIQNVQVKDSTGANASKLDDVLFPDATFGTLYVAETGSNDVLAIRLTGLDPSTPLASIGSLNELGLVDLATGDATGLWDVNSPHGLDFAPTLIPEPSTWAMMLLGFAGLGYAGYRRSRRESAPQGTD